MKMPRFLIQLIAAIIMVATSSSVSAISYNFSYRFSNSTGYTSIDGMFDADLDVATGEYRNMRNVMWTWTDSLLNNTYTYILGPNTTDVPNDSRLNNLDSSNDYAGAGVFSSSLLSNPATATNFLVFDGGTDGGTDTESYFRFVAGNFVQGLSLVGSSSVGNNGLGGGFFEEAVGISDALHISPKIAVPPTGVPDSGSSALLLGAGLIGLAGIWRWIGQI